MVEVLMEPGEEDVGADIAEDDESEHHYIWFQMKKQGEKRLSHKNDVPPCQVDSEKTKTFYQEFHPAAQQGGIFYTVMRWNSIGVMHLSLCR